MHNRIIQSLNTKGPPEGLVRWSLAQVGLIVLFLVLVFSVIKLWGFKTTYIMTRQAISG